MKRTLLYGICFLIFTLGCRKEKEPLVEKRPPTTENPDTMMPLEPVFMAQEHPIDVAHREGSAIFIDERTGEAFYPRGTNYFNIVSAGGGFQDRFFHPNQFNIQSIRASVRKLKGQGYNCVRVFLDTCNDDPDCIGNFHGTGLNQNYVGNIAAFMELAREEDFFLILTSNDLPSQGGYWEASNEGASDLIDGYRNAHYLTTEGVESAVKYWTDLMEALYKEEAAFSHVLAWSILNEHWYFINGPPFSLHAGSVSCANGNVYALSSTTEKQKMAEESIVYYIEKVADVIEKYDGDGLVTMGVFAPNTPHLWRVNDFKYVETSEIVNNSALDFLDLHAYPATSTLSKLMANFKISDPDAKPMIMGEVGAFVSDFSTVEDAGSALQGWIAQSCTFGFDGWLTWGLDRAPLAIGDATWSFLDAEAYLLHELSPKKYPDPCNEAWLGDENLALGRKVTASNFLAGELPEFAVDGDWTTQWGSGGGPPQWLEIDLENVFEIKRIALVVAQYPEGDTEHRILIGSTSDNFSELSEFKGHTKDNDLIEWTGMESNVRFIRVETQASPSWVSWKEVEVY